MTEIDSDIPLTIEQANNAYLRARQDLKNASKKPYLNALDRANKHLSTQHANKLGSQVLNLEFLAMEPVVKSGLAEAATRGGVDELQMNIFRFMARFSNSGVKVYKGPGWGL